MLTRYSISLSKSVSCTKLSIHNLIKIDRKRNEFVGKRRDAHVAEKSTTTENVTHRSNLYWIILRVSAHCERNRDHICNETQNFINGLSTDIIPLLALLSKDAKFVWNNETEEAFALF
jgi:hypothetical protein